MAKLNYFLFFCFQELISQFFIRCFIHFNKLSKVGKNLNLFSINLHQFTELLNHQ
jgi:hypothetical protein